MRVQLRKPRTHALDIRKRYVMHMTLGKVEMRGGVMSTTKGKVFNMMSRIIGWVGIMSACVIFLLSLFSVMMFDMSPIILGLSGVLLALLIVLFVREEL